MSRRAAGGAAGPSDPRRFAHEIVVADVDIDELGHVNNAVYLRYVEEVAKAHSARQGYGLAEYRASGAIPVVRRHVVDYLGSAVRGERLRVSTWVEEMSGVRAMRHSEVARVGADEPMLVRVRTTWVWLDPRTMRPTRVPLAVRKAFGLTEA